MHMYPRAYYGTTKEKSDKEIKNKKAPPSTKKLTVQAERIG